MAWIDDAWVRKAFDALRDTLDVDRHLKKQMIEFLLEEGFWDSSKLDWDSAVARFNSCLNPSKDVYFKLGELWALMKRFGRHQLFLAMADDLGYDVRLRSTEERRQQLLERIALALESCEQVTAETTAELARLTADGHAAPAVAQLVPLSQRPRFSRGLP